MLHAHLDLKVKDLEHLTRVGLSCSTAQINIREMSMEQQKRVGQNTRKQREHAETMGSNMFDNEDRDTRAAK